jgi:hypothetical protein
VRAKGSSTVSLRTMARLVSQPRLRHERLHFLDAELRRNGFDIGVVPGTQRCIEAPGVEIPEQRDLRVAARNAVLEQGQGRSGISRVGDAPGEFTRAVLIQLHGSARAARVASCASWRSGNVRPDCGETQ